MVEKKLIRNLQAFYGGLSSIDIPVYTMDRNQTRELPCMVVGYSGSEPSFSGGYGHHTVNTEIKIAFNGYEDEDNELADAVESAVIDSLRSYGPLMDTVNPPLSGSDSRPSTGFKLKGIVLDSVDRTDEDHSSVITIEFRAWCFDAD